MGEQLYQIGRYVPLVERHGAKPIIAKRSWEASATIGVVGDTEREAKERFADKLEELAAHLRSELEA